MEELDNLSETEPEKIGLDECFRETCNKQGVPVVQFDLLAQVFVLGFNVLIVFVHARIAFNRSIQWLKQLFGKPFHWIP